MKRDVFGARAVPVVETQRKRCKPDKMLFRIKSVFGALSFSGYLGEQRDICPLELARLRGFKFPVHSCCRVTVQKVIEYFSFPRVRKTASIADERPCLSSQWLRYLMMVGLRTIG